jgi:hypothetical protein
MTNLEYYLQDQADALRIEIAGDLTGAGLGSIEHALRTAKSILAVRPIVVAPTAVADASAEGSGLLLTWHRRGARIIARSMSSRALAKSILGASVPMPLAKSGWRQRSVLSSDAALLPPRDSDLLDASRFRRKLRAKPRYDTRSGGGADNSLGGTDLAARPK